MYVCLCERADMCMCVRLLRMGTWFPDLLGKHKQNHSCISCIINLAPGSVLSPSSLCVRHPLTSCTINH